MAGPGIFFLLILIAAYALLLLVLLYIIIRKRRSKLISIPLSVVFIGLLAFALYIYHLRNRGQEKAAQKFLGEYTLKNLDMNDCPNCKVRLKSDYQYDIIVDNEIAGHGKWWLGSAIDIPGYFLELENGPRHIIWEEDRTIDYINRLSR